MEEHRASSAHPSCRRVIAAFGLLLALAPHAWSANDCQRAFEKWAKLSSAHLVPQGDSGRGACVPTEDVRKQLLEGLARAREHCMEPSSSDQRAQQTRTLLNINQSFVASLVVCPSGSADLESKWATKSAPVEEKPKVAAPLSTPQKPVVVAPPPTPQKPVVVAQPPTPPCLEIAPAKEEHYALINRRCRGHSVLAVIEARGAAGETVCRGYTISQSLAVYAPGDTPPRVNHECVLGQGPCNKDRLGSMFPECDW